MIDSKLQEELRAKYSPDGSPLRNLQLQLLEMLKWIDKICKEYNITYWISSGTCLGAVRHGGFIPWDDDVDIEMTEKDYKKFKKVISKLVDSPYVLQTHKTDSNYYLGFPKLRNENIPIQEVEERGSLYKYHGIYIDIFIVTSKIPHWASQLGGIWSYKCREYVERKNKILSAFVKYCIYPVGNSILRPIFSKLKFDDNEFSMIFGIGDWMPRQKKNIFPTAPIVFEGYKLMGPKYPDKYLTDIFGNYHELRIKEPHIELY